MLPAQSAGQLKVRSDILNKCPSKSCSKMSTNKSLRTEYRQTRGLFYLFQKPVQLFFSGARGKLAGLGKPRAGKRKGERRETKMKSPPSERKPSAKRRPLRCDTKGGLASRRLPP